MNTELNDLSTEQAIWEMTDVELSHYIEDLASSFNKAIEPIDEQPYGDEFLRTLSDDCGTNGNLIFTIQDSFLKYLNSGESIMKLGIGPDCEQLRWVAMRGGAEFGWGRFVYPGTEEPGNGLYQQQLMLKCCKTHSISFTRNLGGLIWSAQELQSSCSRVTNTIEREVRNAAPSDFVKNLYGGQCQKCEVVLHGPAGPISEAAHIIEVHSGGADEASNLLCLCPNCHRLLDARAWTPKFEGLNLIAVSYDSEIKTKVMILLESHNVAREAIEWRLKQPLAA
jgi:hypothetical protein